MSDAMGRAMWKGVFVDEMSRDDLIAAFTQMIRSEYQANQERIERMERRADFARNKYRYW